MSNDFFSGLLASISERGRTLLRRAGPPNTRQDASDLIELCEALLSGAGEASGTAIAREVLDQYHNLDEAGRISFFETLARNYGPDQEKLRQAISRPPSTDTLEAGHLDLLVPHPNGQYRIAGWARNPRQNRPAQYIVLGWQTRDDSFHPFTALMTGHRRPDLIPIFKSNRMASAGFDQWVDCSKLPQNAEIIKGWAVDFDHQQVFPVGGSLRLRN